MIDESVHIPLDQKFNFEELYNAVRAKENRIYSDAEVGQLPNVSSGHPHFDEWKLRKQSSNKLTKYLAGKQRPLQILEIGCGNGWLSHQLSNIPGSRVVGSDINSNELTQAGRVFAAEPNLSFFRGEILSDEESEFDVIVFAAAIQYFPSFEKIIHKAFRKLKNEGEIHIIDTHFYPADQIPIAKKRTEEYYNNLGFPEMHTFYCHRSLAELQPFHHHFYYTPGRRSIFGRSSSPFPWICIWNDKK